MIGHYIVRRVNRPGRGERGLRKFAKTPFTTSASCMPEGTTTPQKQCPAVVAP
jgi:hypothetical protein